MYFSIKYLLHEKLFLYNIINIFRKRYEPL